MSIKATINLNKFLEELDTIGEENPEKVRSALDKHRSKQSTKQKLNRRGVPSLHTPPQQPQSVPQDVDKVGEDGRTQLHHAAIEGDCAQIEQLLDGGASRTKRDKSGFTARGLAKLNSHPKAAELLR